jgi:hypothetical protein
MSALSPIGRDSRTASVAERSKATFDIAEIEDLLVEILTFVQDHPGDQAEMKRIFITFIEEDREGITEALEFTMHTLKWPEIREAVEAIHDRAPDSPLGYEQRRWALRILDSFEDPWEGAVLYDHYSDRSA